jgi:hypothetical protein
LHILLSFKAASSLLVVLYDNRFRCRCIRYGYVRWVVHFRLRGCLRYRVVNVRCVIGAWYSLSGVATFPYRSALGLLPYRFFGQRNAVLWHDFGRWIGVHRERGDFRGFRLFTLGH